MLKTGVYIIAEAGVNHNGSLDMACRLIETAAAAGADAVKFQTFSAEKLASRIAQKANYQKETTGEQGTALDMLRSLQISHADHMRLIDHCRDNRITFLSTPFDLESLAFLALTARVDRIKVSSGDLTNGPLLLAAARTGLPIILSTGMSTMEEIRQALMLIAFGYLDGMHNPDKKKAQDAFSSEQGQGLLREKVILLHCTTEYPAPYEEVNLCAMDSLGEFGLPVGLSDHTEGIAVPIAAAARGAVLVEKHFTLDRTLPGPDHRASLDPIQLKAMVQGIRQVEKSMGSAVKEPTSSEKRNMAVARKSLVAACEIKKGELFTPENLSSKRPGNGISPMEYWEWLGRIASRDYDEDELIVE